MYTITDVHDLHLWMVKHIDASPSFRRLTDSEVLADPVVPYVTASTEEGKKVERNSGDKHLAVYRRL